jgi:hypothetical protein
MTSIHPKEKDGSSRNVSSLCSEGDQFGFGRTMTFLIQVTSNYLQSLQANARTVPQIRPCLLRSTSLAIIIHQQSCALLRKSAQAIIFLTCILQVLSLNLNGTLISWLGLFLVFLSPSRKMLGYLKVDHGHFPPHPLQQLFTIILPSIHYTISYWWCHYIRTINECASIHSKINISVMSMEVVWNLQLLRTTVDCVFCNQVIEWQTPIC